MVSKLKRLVSRIWGRNVVSESPIFEQMIVEYGFNPLKPRDVV